MTGKKQTDFHRLARLKRLKLKDIALRWGIQERQMSRIANNPSQKDLDAVAGINNMYAITLHAEGIDTSNQVITVFLESYEEVAQFLQLARNGCVPSGLSNPSVSIEGSGGNRIVLSFDSGWALSREDFKSLDARE